MHVQVHTLGTCVVQIKTNQFMCQRNISTLVFHTMLDLVSSPTLFSRLKASISPRVQPYIEPNIFCKALSHLFHPALDPMLNPILITRSKDNDNFVVDINSSKLNANINLYLIIS